MYERSAIVLERFFSKYLGFDKENNIKNSFNNYCELFQKFKECQKARTEEIAALKVFQDAENEIEDIQAHEEKLYKKNAKLEYNRDLIFQDITQEPDEIERCSQKIETDIAKTQEKLVKLRAEFIEAVRDYNEKKDILAKCKKVRKSAEAEYESILAETQLNVDNILEEYIEKAKDFSESEIEQDVINVLSENGKEEKIPFNNQVITNAAKIGFDITCKEVSCYLQAYNLVQKLIQELYAGAVSMEVHEKAIRNITAEITFLSAETEYIIGFLDYERITVIYGKRMHRSLMIDACDKLEKDIAQINNLYILLAKEIDEKPTKKAYRELYNKSYLMEIEDKDAKFKKEKNRVNLSTGTVMNSNYWRIEGIKNIYTVFYKNIVELFGKDLDEFEIPEEKEEENFEENLESQENNLETAHVDNAEEVIIPENTVEEVETTENPKLKPRVKYKVKRKIKPVKIIEKIDKEEDITQENMSSEKEIDNVSEVADINEMESLDDVINEDVSLDIKPRRTLKLAKIVKKRGRKKLKHYTRIVISENNFENIEENIEENIKENIKIDFQEEHDIFGEKYRDIDSKIAELDELDEDKDESIFDFIEEDNIDDLEEFSNLDFEELEIDKSTKKKTKNKLFDGLKKLNSKGKKKLANE